MSLLVEKLNGDNENAETLVLFRNTGPTTEHPHVKKNY